MRGRSISYFSSIGVIAAAIVSGGLPARAHPHMWVDMRSYVVFDEQGLITAIALEWTFDDGYAQMALDGLDTDGDGVYSQAELEPLTKENIASLKDYNYFVVPRVNGDVVPLKDVTDYGQTYNEKLTLHFEARLAKPVDPHKDEFIYKIYDPEFFIDMQYADKDAIGIVGKMPAGCTLKVIEVTDDAQAQQIKAMLATKGKEWKPPADEDYGGLFAQPALILCNS